MYNQQYCLEHEQSVRYAHFHIFLWPSVLTHLLTFQSLSCNQHHSFFKMFSLLPDLSQAQTYKLIDRTIEEAVRSGVASFQRCHQRDWLTAAWLLHCNASSGTVWGPQNFYLQAAKHLRYLPVQVEVGSCMHISSTIAALYSSEMICMKCVAILNRKTICLARPSYLVMVFNPCFLIFRGLFLLQQFSDSHLREMFSFKTW